MDFPQEVYETLKKYSEAEQQVVATVMNQFQQEFKIEGFIPKLHKTRDKGFDCTGAHVHYFILNFGKDDPTATIKLYCPDYQAKDDPHPLTIKKIEDLAGNLIYENEDYPWEVLRVRQATLNKHQDVNYWELNKKRAAIAEKFLGKAPIYTGRTYPELVGKRCLITGVIDGLKTTQIAFHLKHELFPSFGIERVGEYEIKKIFDLKSIDDELSNNL